MALRDWQIGEKFRVIRGNDSFSVGTVITLVCRNSDNIWEYEGIDTTGIKATYWIRNSRLERIETQTSEEIHDTIPEFRGEDGRANYLTFYTEEYPKPELEIDPEVAYIGSNEISVNKKGGDKEIMAEITVTRGSEYVPTNPDACGRYSDCQRVVGIHIHIHITETRNGYLEYDIHDDTCRVLGSCYSCLEPHDLRERGSNLILGHKKSIMGKLSTIAAKLLDADTKTLVEANILDSELNITPEGEKFVLAQVLDANKKTYATEARKLLDEAKKKKDC